MLDMFGVSLGAIGMLSTLTTALTIDVFGPISDNAGGIAEMANLPEVRNLCCVLLFSLFPSFFVLLVRVFV
jgi:Na+/H+-translocating membrane pyrophosphatase